MVVAAPAAAVVGTAVWLSFNARSSDRVEVVSIPVTATAPSATSTTGPGVGVEDRGEVLALSPPPDGWVPDGERIEQAPGSGTFLRTVLFRAVDGSDAAVSLLRAEMPGELIDANRGDPGIVAVTPGGIEVVMRDTGAGSVSVTEYVDDNLMVTLSVPEALAGDVLALYDQVEFVAPSRRCVTGQEVAVGVEGCDAVTVRVAADGTVEPMSGQTIPD